MDTDSFTQELVEFASVEQQIDMNTNMQTLISMQQTTEATSAMQLVGSTVTISGNSSTLSNATNTPATWSLTTTTPATANVTITSAAGTTAYTGTVALNAGTQTYTWNGQGTNGQTWPDGTYTIAITATGANGQPVTVSTQTQGTVSGVNLSNNPPTLTVNGQSVQISQITSITNGSQSGLSTSQQQHQHSQHQSQQSQPIPLMPTGLAFPPPCPVETCCRDRAGRADFDQLRTSLRQILSRACVRSKLFCGVC